MVTRPAGDQGGVDEGRRPVEAHDDWQVGDRRYLSESSMALLNSPTPSAEEVAQPALMAS
jgi:hypothetical protein